MLEISALSHAPTFGPLILFLWSFLHMCRVCRFEENDIKAVLRNQVKINPPDVYGESALRLQKRVAPKSTHFWVCNFLLIFSSSTFVCLSFFILLLFCLFVFCDVFLVLSSLFLPSFCWSCLVMPCLVACCVLTF